MNKDIKDVIALSMRDALSIRGEHPTSLMISIRESDADASDDYDPHFVFDKASFHAILIIQFDDVDTEMTLPNGRKLTMFSDEHAREIIEFVMTHQHEVDRIFVHCHAGISRSPAVAKFIGEAFNFSAGNRTFPFHNRRVFSTLMRVFHEIL